MNKELKEKKRVINYNKRKMLEFKKLLKKGLIDHKKYRMSIRPHQKEIHQELQLNLF